MKTIFNIFENIIFLMSTSFIIISEFCLFLLFQNRQMFIYRLTDKLSKKNILYVKLFQAIALNNNLIDEETNNELMQFTDTAPYTDEDIDLNLFYKIKNEYNLESDNSRPFKSGMISLVFKLYKKTDKTPIILKIKRKNIDEKLIKSIDNLQFFIYLLSYIPYFNILDISILFNKNIVILKQQLNFNDEIQNMKDSYDNCNKLKYIKIPIANEEVTNKYPNVIMMDFIEGKTISEIDIEDYSIYASLLLKYGMISLLVQGNTHGDLHAGNILFIKNKITNTNETNTNETNTNLQEYQYQIGLIDFGVVLKIEETERDKIFLLISEAFITDPRIFVKNLVVLFIGPTEILLNLPDNHLEKLLDILEEIVKNMLHNKEKTNQSKLYECLIEVNTYIANSNLKKYGLKFSDSFVKMQMALAMCNGINMILCKNDYITFANKTINELFHLDLLNDD